MKNNSIWVIDVLKLGIKNEVYYHNQAFTVTVTNFRQLQIAIPIFGISKFSK